MEEQPKKKKWMFIPILLAAVGGPYALVNGEAAKLLSSFRPSPGNGASQAAFPLHGEEAGYTNSVGYLPNPGGLVSSLPNQGGAGPRLEGPTVTDFAQVIRFDISPRWVAENWGRVSTCTAEFELEGLRVPLVTGPRPDDLAGSLTYYFDKHHAVQRVTFHGTTGDERRLVALLTTVFQFKEQPSLGGGMYVTTYSGKPTSLLRISYAPVVSSRVPNAQKQIAMEINRPSRYYGLSDEMKQLLQADQAVRRW